MNEATTTAMSRWLRMDTWTSGHTLDERRFYDFVRAAWEEYHGLWPEAEIHDAMRQELTQKHPATPVGNWDKKLEDYRIKGSAILEFLSYSGLG